jgi:hypothetical protein
MEAPGREEVDMIEVRRTGEGDPLEFEVIVREGRGETRHRVTMARETCDRLTAGKQTAERCVEAAFRFLLDREPKESILGRFDVTVISRYFPESSGTEASVRAFRKRRWHGVIGWSCAGWPSWRLWSWRRQRQRSWSGRSVPTGPATTS